MQGLYIERIPVCGGGSVLNVAGSTWGRAGRFFFLMIFLITLLPSGFVVVRVVDSLEAGVVSVS